MTLIDCAFPKLRTPKTWLDKCLKSPVWENPSIRKMVNRPKHSWNLHRSTFIIFIDHWQSSWVGKSLSSWHAKSSHCFLTYWLSMGSIVSLRGLIWRYQFRCNYRRNKKLFLKFFLYFRTLVYVLVISEETMTLINFVFPKLRTPKTWLDKCLKSPISEDSSRRNMVNGSKHCWNLHGSTFIIFIDHS